MDAWTAFWFTPVVPTALGVCRCLFYGALLLYYIDLDLGRWAEVSRVFWMPVALFEHLRIPVLPGGWLDVLGVVWKASLALACAGLFTRITTGFAAVSGIYVLGLPQNFGKVHHNDGLIIFVLLILALARSGDAFSLDALIRGRRGPSEPERASGEYLWPIKAVWLMLAVVLCAAGVAKLRRSGLDWAFSDNMSILLVQHNYRIADLDPVIPWGLHIAQHAWLTQLMALHALIVEVGFPLVLFSRIARWLLVPSAFLMLLGIRLTMGPAFVPFLICFVFFVPWDAAARWLRSAVARRHQEPQVVTSVR
jgi:hypothetical protein